MKLSNCSTILGHLEGLRIWPCVWPCTGVSLWMILSTHLCHVSSLSFVWHFLLLRNRSFIPWPSSTPHPRYDLHVTLTHPSSAWSVLLNAGCRQYVNLYNNNNAHWLVSIHRFNFGLNLLETYTWTKCIIVMVTMEIGFHGDWLPWSRLPWLDCNLERCNTITYLKTEISPWKWASIMF